MSIRKRFDLARRVYNLTVRLDAKTTELQDAHRALAKAQDGVKFYTQQCDRKETERRALVDAHDDEKRRLNDEWNRQLVPIDPTAGRAALGARDRTNAHRLAEANERLRTENEELRRDNARLAVLVDECHTKHSEGNPS